jgi:UDP-3-O-[3-hydroxymyristoyl] glucosamine N-acyltransferase
MEFTAQQIADLLHGNVEGEPGIKVHDMSKIEEGEPGTITFLANDKYEEYIYDTKASIALVNDSFHPQKKLPETLTLIKVPNAYESLAQLLAYYDEFNSHKSGIEEPSYIASTAKLGSNVYVGAFSYIGEGAIIGDNVKIYPNSYIGDHVSISENSCIYAGVKIYARTIIGKSCTLHSGAVIGSDGFGFVPNKENNYQKVPQIGKVVLEDHVEIGSNTTIDRATMGSTIIRKGVKIDNLIQIAHNVDIGENTVIAAQTGIAGSTKIGKNTMIGGQVGIVGHIQIADGVKIAAQSGIGNSIKNENQIMQGSPAFSIGDYKRCYVLFRSLPKLKEQLDTAIKEIKEIKNE